MKPINSRRRAGGGLPLLAAVLLGLAGSAIAAPRIVLDIDTGGDPIVGESQHPDYPGWIEAIAFGQGFNSVPASASATREPAMATLGGFSFLKQLDRTSPRIQEALLRGERWKKVVVKYLGEAPAGGSAHAPVQIELLNVHLSGYRVGNGTLNPMDDTGSMGEVPVEEVTLNYTEVVWRYREIKDDQVGGETSMEFFTMMGTEDPGYDDDGDGIDNANDPDDDNDSIPDSYEVANGLDPYSDDSEGDKDQDKQSNRDEYVTNTRADDPGSFYAIDSLTFRRTPAGIEGSVSFPVTGGRRYRLLATPSIALPREDWIVLDEFEVPAGRPETAADVELQSAVLGNAARLFFEVEVRMISPTP